MLLDLPNALTKEQLPDNAITVSRSQISTAESCLYKWHLTYQRGLRSAPSQRMRLGTAIHELWQAFYEHFLGHTPYELESETMFEISNKARAEIPSDYEDQLLFLRANTLLWKYAQYSRINDTTLSILAVEQEMYVFLGFEIDGRPVFAHGFPDLVAEQAGIVVVFDHKSGGKAWTEAQAYFDPQVPYYMLMLHLMGVTPEAGVIQNINTYNYKNVNKEPLDKLFSRVYTYHREDRLKTYHKHITEYIKWLYDQPHIKTFNRECAYCPFRDICNTEMRGMNSEPLIEEFMAPTDLVLELEL